MAQRPPQAAQKSDKKRGKQPKKFVEQQDAAIKLALSIAEVQEGKSKEKVEKRKQTLKALKSTGERKKDSNKPSAKDRIKEKKAIIAAQKAQKKKEKVTTRKGPTAGGNEKGRDIRAGEASQVKKRAEPAPARKRVSFA
ncbi:hypothetical protein OE88DRAFT_1733191 [Heliocybe sulcata]|uniref:Uncharacterized protein n=1 Tax=Heliocybe sulcata TaxID=5364 RepID=A0A5C3NB15_9AGAM|nr:hypothetical protein OE88DRAFT_1733191 [Heliocybe sulcata]